MICASSLQGKRDLNPQPSVLETDALPIELLPSGAPSLAASSAETPLHGRTKTVVTGHQTTESTDDYHESRTAGIGGTPLVPWNAVPWNDTSWSEGDGGAAATSPSDLEPDKSRDKQGHAEDSGNQQQAPGIVGELGLSGKSCHRESSLLLSAAVDSPRR